MGVYALSTTGNFTFKSKPILEGGDGKSYQMQFTCSGGAFQEGLCGFDTTYTNIVLAAFNTESGGSIRLDGQCIDDPSVTWDTSVDFGPGQSYGVFTETTPEGTMLLIANAPRVKAKYFGGENPTVKQVFDKIKEKYGNYAAFSLVTAYSSVPFFPGYAPNSVIKGAIGSFADVKNQVLPDIPISYSGGQGLVAPADCLDVYDIAAWIMFGDPVPLNHLKFHVYIDGTSEPNISVRYEAVSTEPAFSLQTTNAQVTAHMIGYGSSYMEQQDVIMDDTLGVYVPNASAWYDAFHNYTWGGGKYDKPYITQNNELIGGLSALERLIIYGGNIADRMELLLQFTHQSGGILTRGQMYRVVIPQKNIQQVSDISVTEVNPSLYEAVFTTTVEVHLEAPPDKDTDDDDDYPDPDPDSDDFSDGEVDGFPGEAVLTKTYAMTAAVLENVGTKLWTQSYFDVLKVQSNPIENIVGCKWYPFALTGTSEEIVVGDVGFGINADKINTKYVATIGSYTYTSPFGGEKAFMAMSPYTTIKLHLPYVGIIQLDPTEIYNRKLTVKYTVDLITGDCLVLLYLDDTVPYMSIPGSLGVDIPLTSSNRVQSELRAASTGLSAATGAAGHLMGQDLAGAAASAAGGFINLAGMDYNTQRTANHNSACSSWENHSIYLEIWYHPNNEADSQGFKRLHGLPCHKYCAINNDDGSLKLSGYVQADHRTKIDFAMTAEENRMLEDLMIGGVYVN